MDPNVNEKFTQKDGDISGRTSNSSLQGTLRNSMSLPPPPPSDSLLNRYNRLLDLYPLKTKMITAACVSAFGSALGSYLSATNAEQRSRNRHQNLGVSPSSKSALSKINWIDVLSYALHSGLIQAPICHYWFEWLSVNGPKSNTASVLVDQVMVQPPLLVLMFICLDIFRANMRRTLDLFRKEGILSQALANAGPTVVASWRFWPFAVYFTFKYLKKKHYTVALNLCSVAWTVYLSKTSGAGDVDNK
mmetsp:Transcript_24805/g.49439  ORF Transcript_24805/g.49439 Transcript_24805/m.49439 type:complete len:247 (+) Transcript_24805:161-901(+)